MAFTVDEEQRIQRIEKALAEHTTAINNLASKRQLTHVNSLTEKNIRELRELIASLQSQLDTLKK
jgi:hypothetical protein